MARFKPGKSADSRPLRELLNPGVSHLRCNGLLYDIQPWEPQATATLNAFNYRFREDHGNSNSDFADGHP